MASFFIPPKASPTSGGANYSAARLYFYESGTTTAAVTYQDADLSTPHESPVEADANGVFPVIYLDPSADYRVQLKTSADALIYDVDPYEVGSFSSSVIGAALYPLTDAEETVGATISSYVYPELDVRRYGAVYDGVTDDSLAIQTAIDVAEEKGGGEVLLQSLHWLEDQLTLDEHCVVLSYKGGSSRNDSTDAGGRLIFSGPSTAIKIDGGTGGIIGCGLNNVRVENQGSVLVGVHVFNAQNCRFENVHVREFTNDNWLLECDTNVSSIYNSWANCSGWTDGATANGIRMVEGVGKAVNNNLFLNCHFGNNLVGIKQDTDCHDNAFLVLELGSCTTGAKIRGRTHFAAANIESCTTGVELVTGGAGSVSGSIHFASNTADISNPDGLPFAAVKHGGDAGSSITFSAKNTAMGFRGATPPSTGGINFVTTDGDPKLQRAGSNHVTLESSNTLISTAIELDGALNHDGSTVGFYGTTPVSRPSVTWPNTATATTTLNELKANRLMAALVALGLIVTT